MMMMTEEAVKIARQLHAPEWPSLVVSAFGVTIVSMEITLILTQQESLRHLPREQ